METPIHILEEILAKLPLKSISKFKSVCKTWKSILESAHFRSLFMSTHQNSSSSWSLMYGAKELIGFHGCQTWNLPKSPYSYIPQPFISYEIAHFVDSTNGLVLIKEDSLCLCYVGNPVLEQWVWIPPCPEYSTLFRLVTRVDKDGVVSSFKVVRLAPVNVNTSKDWTVYLYSSDTGMWTTKRIYSPYQTCHGGYIIVNGTIYSLCRWETGVLLAHDFYSDSDQFRVIQFPDYASDNKGVRRVLTRSGEFLMLVRTLALKEETVLKVWRLNNDLSWKVLWEIGFPVSGIYCPIAMHPFDSGIVYLCHEHEHDSSVLSCDLRTQNYRIIRDAYNDGHQDCIIDESVCKETLKDVWCFEISEWKYTVSIWLCQFVFPRWLEPVPHPPQAELIDTTSLVSYINDSMQKKKK